MKLSNTSQIRAEDFKEEYEELITQLGSTLNFFMQEVVDLSDKRINFDNKEENLIQFDVTVDSSGKPTQQTRVNTGRDRVIGTQVINAVNTNSVFATSCPFINFKPLGGGLIEVSNITGLPANNKFRITAIIY